MDNVTAKEIADIIKQQLATTNTTKVWSWGVHAWKYGTSNNNAFLLFRVSGLRFKGQIKITLMPNNTYQIDFIKKDVTIDTKINVYHFNMVDIIDNYVEYTGDQKSYTKALEKVGYNFSKL